MAKKKFTVAQLADAIEKNGLPQTYGWFFRDKYGNDIITGEGLKSPEIYAACAVGQAAINLGVELESFRDAVRINDLGLSITGFIEDWNDRQLLPFEEIARKIRNNWAEFLDKEFEAEEFTYDVRS